MGNQCTLILLKITVNYSAIYHTLERQLSECASSPRGEVDMCERSARDTTSGANTNGVAIGEREPSEIRSVKSESHTFENDSYFNLNKACLRRHEGRGSFL